MLPTSCVQQKFKMIGLSRANKYTGPQIQKSIWTDTKETAELVLAVTALVSVIWT